MSRAVRLHRITTPRIVIRRRRKARVGISAVCPRPVRLGEVAAETVLVIVYDTPSLVEAESRVCEWPVNDTPVALAAVGAKAEIIGPEDTCFLDGSSIGISLLIPVWLSSCVVAFLLKQNLVHAHVVAVPRPELPDIVDIVGLDNVRHLQLVPPVLGAVDAQLGWLGHQACFGPDVFRLLFIGQGVPVILVHQYSFCDFKIPGGKNNPTMLFFDSTMYMWK